MILMSTKCLLLLICIFDGQDKKNQFYGGSKIKDHMKCGNMTDDLLCGSPHVDSRGRGVRSFCDGEIHPNPTTIQLHAIGSFLCLTNNEQTYNHLLNTIKHFRNRFVKHLSQLIYLYLFSVTRVLKVNKSKAPGASRLLVIHDRDVCQGAVLREDVPQISLCGVQAQTKHSQATVWIWICLQFKYIKV